MQGQYDIANLRWQLQPDAVEGAKRGPGRWEQWRSTSQGTVGAIANVGLDSDKIFVGSVVIRVADNLTENMFFFLREAFCGPEYTENAFAAGALP